MTTRASGSSKERMVAKSSSITPRSEAKVTKRSAMDKKSNSTSTKARRALKPRTSSLKDTDLTGFDLFLGVDQTGAAVADGTRAKPLPCTLLSRVSRVSGEGRDHWRLRTLWIPELTRDAVLALAAEAGIASASRLAIIADCV